MKRMKKLFAILMTMAMVMGLGITGFAATTATITISGLAQEGENNVTLYKILEPDVTTDSGYKFTNGITQIGEYQDVETFLAATDGDRQDAIRNATKTGWTTVNTGSVQDLTYTATVEAGYYAAIITNSNTSIVYNVVLIGVEYDKATYLGDGEYRYDIKEGQDLSPTAKYTKIPTTKDVTSEDKEDGVTELGRTVSYSIVSYMPTEGTTSFSLVDTLTGAEYNQESVEITIGTQKLDTDAIDNIVSFNPDENKMTINLSSYCTDANVGKKVVITYNVQVTDKYVKNTVVPTIPGHDTTSTPTTELKTGAIEILKTGEKEDKDKLNGAKFVVYKVENGDNVYLKRNISDDRKVSYTWVTKENATKFVTGIDGIDVNDGKILIEGLDLGTYYFEEVEAPDGYSINNAAPHPSVTLDEDSVLATATRDAVPEHTSLANTQLSALPSTGGMGTTLFTIAGCVIMISAAGLFFATRKKAN